MLKNGSFTEGWTDLPPAPGNLINQQPNGWTLTWVEPGKFLFGSNDLASGVPECVHKLSDQLPDNEKKGGKDALILEGDTTYKIFHFGGAFGAELKQIVTGLKPGATAKLTVPVLAVLYDDPDPFAAESGVWVNGEGEWVNGGRMGNREWFRHEIEFEVPDNGTAVIEIRVKSKWPRKKDFFIDGVTLTAEEAPETDITQPGGEETPVHVDPTPGETQPTGKTVQIKVPQGMKVITAVANEPNIIVLAVPAGTTVDIS